MELVPSNHFTLCRPLFLPSSIFPSIRVFSNESVLPIRCPKYSASVSVPPMNIQDRFPLGLTRLISLQSKGLSRVFSNTAVQKHQFFGAQLSYTPTVTSIQFSSVAQSCPTCCDPMNHSTPGLPVHHQLPDFTQTHVHRVGDAIKPSHPLSSPSPPAPNLSQHQGLCQCVNSLHEVAKVLEFQL